MESTTKDLPKIQEPTQFNINHRVKVILTPRGLEVLREVVLEQLASGYSDRTTEGIESTIKVLYRRGDYYVFQAYEFMAIFGPSLPTVSTMEPRYNLFEGNDIILLPDNH